MELEAFFQEKMPKQPSKTVTLSRRLEDHPFILAPISEEQDEEIRRSCRRMSADGEKALLDRELYLLRLVCHCVQQPDLKNAQLQRSWGVLGEENLLKKMLLPGEYDVLARYAEEICGFHSDGELVQQIKNA